MEKATVVRPSTSKYRGGKQHESWHIQSVCPSGKDRGRIQLCPRFVHLCESREVLYVPKNGVWQGSQGGRHTGDGLEELRHSKPVTIYLITTFHAA